MSDVEAIKLASRNLRGTIAQSLREGGSHFSADDVQLIKFHGMYQQDDRDVRAERKRAQLEPAYQFMLRSRIPGGALTAQQYLLEDTLARRFGNGTLRITTRQGIQLHGILKGDLRTAIQEMTAVLLSSIAACGDVNRNVMACPSPAKDAVHQTVQRFASDLARHFTPRTRAYHEIWIDGEKVDAPELGEETPDPIYGRTYLPRKFKMGVVAPGDNCIDVYTQDIGFVPVIAANRVAGYTMLVGGGMGMTHGKSTTYPRTATPLCFAAEQEAIEIAQAVLEVQRDFGDRENRKHSRFKYLVEERGIAWIRSQVEQRIGRTLSLPIDVPFIEVCDHLGWQPQADGRYALGIHVQNGRVQDTSDVRLQTGLREAIARFEPAIRLTAQQNIILCDITAEERAVLEALLRAHGIETDPGRLGLGRDSLACPALPTCGLALTDAERVLPAVVAQIQADVRELGLERERIAIRMTGCPNGCARPYMGDVGFVGRSKDLYDIYVGGDAPNTQLNWLYKSSIRREHLASEIRPLLAAWKHERSADETFGDYCTRVGRDRLLECAGVPA